MKMFLMFLLTTRSTYLILYLNSGSLKASYVTPSFSLTIGRGLNDLHNTVISFTWMEISPILVRKTNPFTPMKSPMSKSF